MQLSLVYDTISYFVHLEEFKKYLALVPDRSRIQSGRTALVRYWSEQIPAPLDYRKTNDEPEDPDTTYAILKANELATDMLGRLQYIEQAIQYFPTAQAFEESDLWESYKHYVAVYRVTPPGCLKTLVRELKDPSVTRFRPNAREPKCARQIGRHPYKPNISTDEPTEISV